MCASKEKMPDGNILERTKTLKGNAVLLFFSHLSCVRLFVATVLHCLLEFAQIHALLAEIKGLFFPPNFWSLCLA